VASGQPPVGRVLVSAHASHGAGAKPRTIETYRDAVATSADYVEFDVRRTADGELVAFHDAFHDPGTGQEQPLSALAYPRLCELAGYEVPRVADILAAIKGRAKGHLDLKETGYEHRLVQLALDVLGPGGFIVTSLEDASVAAIRSRFGDAAEVPVALTLGRGMKGSPSAEWLRTRAGELWPASRLRACGADWAAVNHRLALAGAAGRCRRQHRKVMVWTVNAEREIRYWLGRPIDVLVTDRPALAIALRDQGTRPGPRPGD
jgi:glycerophosphoryl diester phosphodiesterase